MSREILNKIICVFVCFFLFGMLEVGARVFYRDHNTLDDVLSVIEQDAGLMWKQKPGLHTRFENSAVKTDSNGFRVKDAAGKKNRGSLRIICLGGSATFGWGVEAEQAYPDVLRALLQKEYPSMKDIEVINAGIIGYSSFQGLRFFKKTVLGMAPDIITVSYLVNDMDKLRFYQNNGVPDKDVKTKNKLFIVLENTLETSAFYRFLKKNMLSLQGVTPHFYGTTQKIYPRERRVSPYDYGENLKEIVRFARVKGIKVVLIKMPIAAQAGSDHNVSAEEYFREALEYKSRNEKALSEIYFKKAKQQELWEVLKISRSYYAKMEEIAAEEEVPLVDAVSAYQKHMVEKGGELFVNPSYDLVHPNVLGHAIIGEEILRVIERFNLISKKPI